MLCRLSLSVISAAFMALGRSCLLANTSSTASRSSSCGQAQQEGSAHVSGAGIRASGLPRGLVPVLGPHLVEHALQLVPGLADTVAVIAVHHEDEALCVLEVVPPQGADLQGTTGRQGTRHSSPAASSQPHPGSTPALTLSWPPTSHTVKLMFLYSTVSTLKPAAGRGGQQGCGEGSVNNYPPHCQGAYQWWGWWSQSLPA